MNKRKNASQRTCLLIGVVALMSIAPAAADTSVTGEAKAYSSATTKLQLSVNASGGDGAASGSAQYTRLTAEGAPELELDMPVSCMWVADDAESVVMAGPAAVTSNPGSAAVGEWFVIALQKRPAEKERIRTLFATQREAAAKCANGETLFPAIVDSGGFEITQGEAGQSNLLGTGRDVNIDPDRVGGSRNFPLPDPGLNIDAKASSRCSAHFPFNGTLEDSTGNGHDAMMVGLDRLPTGSPAEFQIGKFGQALSLTGDSVAVAPLDLHFDDCPKITISAWVHLLSERSGQMAIVSTGHGAGPRLALTKSNASAWGGANEIRTRSRDWAPETGVWFPIVAVWDYESGTHTLYMRGDEGALTEELGNYSREPQQDFWIGTYAYGSTLMNVAADILIDDLRVYDRILDSDEISAALAGTLPVGSDCDCETSTGEQIPLSGTLPNQGAGLGETELPQQVGDHDFSGNTPVIDPADFPDRPTEVLPEGGAGGILDAPPSAGAGPNDPSLSMPDDTLGGQLQDDIDAARESTPIVAGPTDEISCDSPGNPLVRAAITGTFPSEFVNALQQARDCGYAIKVAALNKSGQWLVSTLNQIAYSDNVPSSLAATLDTYEHQYGGLDAADISGTGAWVVIAGKEFEQQGLTADAKSAIQYTLGGFGKIASFSFHPSDSSRWLLVDTKGAVTGGTMQASILNELENLAPSKRIVHEARYAPDGSWVMLGNDRWFATDGVQTATIATMDSIRRAGRDIGHIVFSGSQTNYMIITNGPQPSRPTDPIWRVENGLKGKNIWAKLRDYNLTGVSIAMIRDNQVEWARGYGVRVTSDPESYVRPDTIFDVASISKPVAAFGALQLVESGKLSVTRVGVLKDIEQLISAINRPSYRSAVRPEASNLAQVLQHCASICYSSTPDCASPGGSGGGAGEYATDANLPTVAQLIRGSGPAYDNRKLIRTGNPGVRTEYTSANYMLVQALIEVHGGGFLNHMERLLNDLGMASSTYRSPFPGRNGDRFARGHEKNNPQPIVAYPEMAAASLTSTPADIAKFVIAMNRDGQSLLSPPLVDQFLGREPSRTNAQFPDPDFIVANEFCANAPTETMALGIRHRSIDSNWGNNETFWHGGSHNGYRTRMVGLPGMDSGLVVFMTGSSGDVNGFYQELRNSVVSAYGF